MVWVQDAASLRAVFLVIFSFSFSQEASLYIYGNKSWQLSHMDKVGVLKLKGAWWERELC